jgi:hypothetical protein
MSTGTITRQQLREAIQAGITQAELRRSFTPEAAAQLFRVADRTEFVAYGSYRRRSDEGLLFSCPVAQAFPDYQLLMWDTSFTVAFDTAMQGRPHLLRVTDEPQEGTGA